MPLKAIHHIDLAVGDIERSLAFYLAVLGPLGAAWEMFVFDPDGLRFEIAYYPLEE
ncbi:MAG: hypothetical protein QOE87_2172 [Gaiellales bacterium]|nr:hypothetical protein [Gaiellales bacterium]